MSDDADNSDGSGDETPHNRASTEGTHDRADRADRPVRMSGSDRRRRAVRQLLFVVAGSHTGAFLGSSLPTRFGLPGDVSGALLVVFLFALPFAVDSKWERIEATTDRLGL